MNFRTVMCDISHKSDGESLTLGSCSHTATLYGKQYYMSLQIVTFLVVCIPPKMTSAFFEARKFNFVCIIEFGEVLGCRQLSILA